MNSSKDIFVESEQNNKIHPMQSNSLW